MNSLRKADGMFALAIFDKVRGDFYLARDRVGEKPLYYFQTQKGFCFGSELKALVSIYDRQISIDQTGLQLYLLLRYVPAPWTILADVKKILPGHYIKFNLKKPELNQTPYFSWDPHPSEMPGYSGAV